VLTEGPLRLIEVAWFDADNFTRWINAEHDCSEAEVRVEHSIQGLEGLSPFSKAPLGLELLTFFTREFLTDLELSGAPHLLPGAAGRRR